MLSHGVMIVDQKAPSAWAMIAWDENFHYDTVYEERSIVNYAIRQWNTRK
ncbi:hypothetical protein AB3569_06870 [Acinetobacter baumannii]